MYLCFWFCFCMRCFLLVFSIFFSRRLSTILLVIHLSHKAAYAEIFVRYEIFVTAYFLTFSLANILIISCRFYAPIIHFKPSFSVTHTFFVSNKITNRYIYETLSSGDSSPLSKLFPSKYHLIECTSIIVL